MRKRDIVVKISQQVRMKQVVVADIVQRTFDTIIEALKQGQRIELRNFGVFDVKSCKSRMARNPRTGEKVPVPAHSKITFKIGRELKHIFVPKQP